MKATGQYFALEDGPLFVYEEKLKRSMVDLDDSFLLVKPWSNGLASSRK